LTVTEKYFLYEKQVWDEVYKSLNEYHLTLLDTSTVDVLFKIHHYCAAQTRICHNNKLHCFSDASIYLDYFRAWGTVQISWNHDRASLTSNFSILFPSVVILVVGSC